MTEWSWFARPEVRASARVAILLLPTIAYSIWSPRIGVADFFLLRRHWSGGIRVGALVAATHLILLVAAASSLGRLEPRLPTDIASWLNFIVGSPFGEELLFRGFVLRRVLLSFDAPVAVAVSATAFASIHIPSWVLTGDGIGPELVVDFATMLLYGVIFGVVVLASRSLWASLIPHWGNNLIAVALGG